MHILIAGGSGTIGQLITKEFREQGHSVSILTRSPKSEDQFYWNPQKNEIDTSILGKVDVLINVSGADLSDQRWTDERKKELYDSRIGTNKFLFEQIDQMPNLKQFISSSGINCYGYEDPEKIYSENDPFGNDYISQLVKDWEESADLFHAKCKVVKIRTAIVLDTSSGALQKMLKPVKLGIGSPLGSGEQQICWIHSEDLARIFLHVITNELDGAYNSLAGYVSNKELLKTIAKVLDKPFWAPAVPSFLLKTLFGEMSILILKGIKASNEKIKASGFTFNYTTIEEALKDLLG